MRVRQYQPSNVIPGMDIDTYPAVCKRIRDAGHEIGHHGDAHEAPMSLAEEASSAPFTTPSRPGRRAITG
jgi:peptidoglycan/xylan/chitin deacetylase (PgdA/CDA1 family)